MVVVGYGGLSQLRGLTGNKGEIISRTGKKVLALLRFGMVELLGFANYFPLTSDVFIFQTGKQGLGLLRVGYGGIVGLRK